MEKYASANVDSHAPVLNRISQRARLDATHLCQDPLAALTARLVSTQHSKGLPSVLSVEMTSTKVIPMQSCVSKLNLVSIDQVRQRKSTARQESMVLVATQRVKTAMLDSSKISQGTRGVGTAPLDTATNFAAPPVATLSHPDPTVGMEKYASATLDSFVLVLI